MQKFAIQLVIFYIVLNTVVYFLANYLIFRPTHSTYKKIPNLLTLTTANGKKISAVYLLNPTAKYVILYSHGNNEDLGDVIHSLRALYNMGFSVIGYDYEGYGTSEGQPSERAAYRDIEATYNYLVKDKKIPAQKIILMGRSVGSGPSTEFATKQPVAGVILISPFVSTYRVITHYPILLFDKFNNLAKINKIKAPILFIHGKEDTIVPFWHGEKLSSAFLGEKTNCWVENFGHNDLYIGQSEVKNCILKFVHQL